MQCCGQDRTTKFCPDCGTPVLVTPLIALLRYVEKNAKMHLSTHESRATLAEEELLTDPKRTDRTAAWSRRALKRHRDWQEWADELGKAIAALERENDADT